MALIDTQLKEIVISADAFMLKRRPPLEIRDKVDLAYRVDGHHVEIYAIRPQWNDPSRIINEEIAKATYVASRKIWKVYWMRGNLKWTSYEPRPQVGSISQFFRLVDEDKYHCFFG